MNSILIVLRWPFSLSSSKYRVEEYISVTIFYIYVFLNLGVLVN